jgi:hypothetical protein
MYPGISTKKLFLTVALSQLENPGTAVNFTSLSCCQLAWMVRSQALSSNSFTCNQIPLANISSNCSCKGKVYSSLPSTDACLGSVNATEYQGECYVNGCPAGLRAFQTNLQPSIFCDDFQGDSYSLYETSCQGRLSVCVCVCVLACVRACASLCLRACVID